MPRATVSNRWPGFSSIVPLVILALFTPHASAYAQGDAVSGVVKDSLTGLPLSEALVRADRTTLSSRTNARGQFTLAGLTGTTVTLVVSHLGYQPTTQTASVGRDVVRHGGVKWRHSDHHETRRGRAPDLVDGASRRRELVTESGEAL